MRLNYKQNWINHVERTDNTRLPKHALNYEQRGRDRGRPKKRRQCVNAGTGQTTQYKKIRTDIQLKFYKAVARPSLLYGSETWVTTKRDMTCLEDTEICFQRSATGCTRLDKI